MSLVQINSIIIEQEKLYHDNLLIIDIYIHMKNLLGGSARISDRKRAFDTDSDLF